MLSKQRGSKIFKSTKNNYPARTRLSFKTRIYQPSFVGICLLILIQIRTVLTQSLELKYCMWTRYYVQSLPYFPLYTRPLTWISNMATIRFEVRRLKLGLQWPSQSIQFPSECLLSKRRDYLFVAEGSRLFCFLHHTVVALYLSSSLSGM
jgi:hypothetical protein